MIMKNSFRLGCALPRRRVPGCAWSPRSPLATGVNGTGLRGGLVVNHGRRHGAAGETGGGLRAAPAPRAAQVPFRTHYGWVSGPPRKSHGRLTKGSSRQGMPQANEVPQETRTSLWPHTSRRRTTQTVTATLIIGQAANSSHATGAGANGAGCGDCGCVCERVTLLSGQFSAGRRPEGGFRVAARLPA